MLCERRSLLGKVQVMLQKNVKALLAKIHEICDEEIWVSVQMPSVKI